VISRTTFDLVRGYFDVVELGPQQLRGVAQPLDLFKVLRSTGAERRLEAVRDRTPMVGRKGETTDLLAAWANTVDGRPSSVLIEGEAGIGKSRLVELVTNEVERQGGGSHLTIGCTPLHTKTVLNPVIRLLVRAAGLDRDDASSPWTRLVECLARAGPTSVGDAALFAALLSIEVPGSVEVPELTPEHRREQTFQAFIRLVDAMAATAPLLIVAEDVHWADPSTIELLRRLAGRATGTRTMLLLTSRPGGPELDGGAVARMVLEPLDRRHIDEMVMGLLPADLPAAVREQVVERSDGVPLFIEELSHAVVGPRDESPSWPPGASMAVPPSLHDLLVARLDSLPREKLLAQAVATIGQPASVRLIDQILDLDTDVIERGLEALAAADILVVGDQAGSKVYSFGHALLRDAAYDSQLRAHGRSLHARVARALEEEWPEVAEKQPELLAHHFGCAGQGLRSAGCWYAAGLIAAGLAAHTEAAGHFRNALAVLDEATDAQGGLALRLSVHGALARSLSSLLGYTAPEVEEAYQQALDVAAEAEAEGPAMATTWGLWAYYSVRGEHAVALELAARCHESAEAGSNQWEELEAAGILGVQRFYLGHFPEARTLLRAGATHRAGVDVSAYPHDPGVASLAHLAPTLLVLGYPRKAEETMTRALARAEDLRSSTGLFTRAFTHAFAACYYQLACEPERAAEHATRTIEISAEHGFATWLGAGALHLAIAEATLGNPARSIAGIEWGLSAWVEAGAELFRPYFLFWLAEARRNTGDPVGALEAVDEALELVIAHNERFFEAELLRLRGELTEDTDVLMEAIDVAQRQQAKTFELRAATSLHRLSLHQGRRDETAALPSVVAWFPERLDTPDLEKARAVLQEVRA